MKKIFLVFVLMLGVASVTHAKPVDKAVAARVANDILKKQVVDATPNAFTECYLFVGVDGKGFAIIAADDCVRPLLAYSPDGTFDADRMPAHVASWFEGYQREIASVVAAGIVPSPQVQAMWESPVQSKTDHSVAPLLSTRWAQGAYYNSLCPYDIYDSTYVYTGCTATAMAQIMKYWEWPLGGWNSHTYTHSTYGTLSADFGNTAYRWDRMPDTLNVSQKTKILFPIVITVVVGLVAPKSLSLIGFLMFGNLIRECGVLNSISASAQNELANLVTIVLGISISTRMQADEFLKPETLLIMLLGLIAFVFDTVGGVMFAKLINLFLPKDKKLNPMIGATGISAFPMSARVVHKMGLEEDPQNFLLMQTIGVNVSGQIASVIAAGVLLNLV